jgi:hypothetical protein
MVRAALVEAGIQPEFTRARPEHPYHPTVFAEPWRVTVPEAQLADARAALARLEHDVAEEADLQARAWAWKSVDSEQRGGRRPTGEGVEPDDAADFAVGELQLPPLRRQRLRFWTALALGFVLPFPAVCFYAKARRLGALFLGLFLAGVGAAIGQAVLHPRVHLGAATVERHRTAPAASAHVSATRGTRARVEAVAPPDPNEPEPRTGLASLAAVEWLSALGLSAKLGDLAVGLSLIMLERRRSRDAGAGA